MKNQEWHFPPKNFYASVPLCYLGDDIPELYYKELQNNTRKARIYLYSFIWKSQYCRARTSPFFGLCPPEINTTEVYCLAKRHHPTLPQLWSLGFKLHRIQSPFHSYYWDLSASSPENRAQPPALPVNRNFHTQNQRGVHITTKKFNTNTIN